MKQPPSFFMHRESRRGEGGGESRVVVGQSRARGGGEAEGVLMHICI